MQPNTDLTPFFQYVEYYNILTFVIFIIYKQMVSFGQLGLEVYFRRSDDNFCYYYF